MFDKGLYVFGFCVQDARGRDGPLDRELPTPLLLRGTTPGAVKLTRYTVDATAAAAHKTEQEATRAHMGTRGRGDNVWRGAYSTERGTRARGAGAV